MASFLQGDRFYWGVNIDNMWLYAGAPVPRSIIIPYLLSVRLPRGPFRFPISPTMYKASPLANSNDGSKLAEQRKERCVQLALDLKQSGIQFVRAWFEWNFFEPNALADGHPQYLFPLDDFVNELRDNGIKLVAVLGNGYTRFLPQGLNVNDPNSYVLNLAKSSRAIVDHYSGKIDAWQIENEPNWWMEHYATHWRSGGVWLDHGIRDRILSELHDIVREEDPSATVVVNLEADHSKTDWKFYARFCDVLGLDFYPNYSHASPVDASRLSCSSDVKKVAGVPVFVAETGYPSGPTILGYDEKKQADYVRQACEESYGNQEVNGLCVWRFSDSYWRSFPDQENHFGMLDKSGDPKLAWKEYLNQIQNH